MTAFENAGVDIYGTFGLYGDCDTYVQGMSNDFDTMLWFSGISSQIALAEMADEDMGCTNAEFGYLQSWNTDTDTKGSM